MGNVDFDKKLKKYLEDLKNGICTKCIIIVTDKQCAIASIDDVPTNNNGDSDSHDYLTIYLENEIHPNDNSTGWQSYKLHDVYLFLEGPEITVTLPLSSYLSINQAEFLIDILGNICKFNAENDDLIKIDIMNTTDYKEYCTHNINVIGKYILSNVTEMYVTTDEKIIGKTWINVESYDPKVYEKH